MTQAEALHWAGHAAFCFRLTPWWRIGERRYWRREMKRCVRIAIEKGDT
jgi:hypothetical protein